MKINSKINRRQLLKNTAGTAAVSALGASSMNVLANSTAKAKNVIFFYVPFGAPFMQWTPEMVNGELQLNTCTAPYESVKNRCVFFDRMNTNGSLQRDLESLSVEGFYGPSIIEELANERAGQYPIDFLPISSTSPIVFGTIKNVNFHTDPWDTYDFLNESSNLPYIEMLEKNTQHAMALLNKTSGLDQDEVSRYKNKLTQVSTELSSINGELLDIPGYRSTETYEDKTDIQIINAVSAIKANKTSVVHFMTGETYNQSVMDGQGDYYTVIHSGNEQESILQRTAFDQKVADLISLLETTNDASGEALIESTLVVLYSNEGVGDYHDTDRSPFLLAGGSFLNGGQINNSEDHLEFIDTIIAATNSSYPYVSSNGPLTELLS